MTYILYRQRWIILAGVLSCAFVRGYLPSMFAICNNALIQYLRISPFQADLLTSVDTAVAVVVCIATSILGKVVGVRLLSLNIALSFALCSGAVGVGITNRDLYALMLVGRLFSGISAAVLYFLPAIFANAWFPSSQISTVGSSPVTFMCLGGMVSPIVFANLLPQLNDPANSNSSTNVSNDTYDYETLRNVFIYNMAVMFALSVGSLGIFCLFATNHPPTPPSNAQERLLRPESNGNHSNTSQKYFETYMAIPTLPSFRVVCLLIALTASSLAFSVYLQPSMIKATFPSIPNEVVGYCMVVTTIASAGGSIGMGKILDKWRSFKNVCLFGLASCIISGIAVYFGHIYEKLEVLFISHAVMGFSRLSVYICCVELLLEVTYPLDRTISTCLFFALYNLTSFSWTPLERFIMVAFGEQNVAWVVVSTHALAAVVLWFWKPKYNRSMANNSSLVLGTDAQMDKELLGNVQAPVLKLQVAEELNSS